MGAATFTSLVLSWKKHLQLILIFCFGAAVSSAWAATNNVVHIRFTPQPTQFKVVFDISTPLHYKLTNANGELTLTMLDTHLRFPLPSLPSNTFISEYRSQTQGENLKFSFDLSKAAGSKVYLLAPADGYGDRLVLELNDADSPLKQPVALAEKKPTAVHTQSLSQQEVPRRQSTSSADSEESLETQPLVATKVASSHRKTIVIDPGHGGKDPGAVGPAGYQEKNAVLAISKILQQILRQQGYQVVLTRDRDFFIPLRQRLAIARRYKPDLFVAVHADAAYAGSSAYGASVFALSERGATSEGARWLAMKENQSELVDGIFVDKDPMLRSVLLDLSQTHTIGVSLDMGQQILQQLSKVTHLHYAGVEQAAFVVLKSPDIPSLLIETGYITNPKQEQQLNNPVYQRQLASNIAQGINGYFASHPQ